MTLSAETVPLVSVIIPVCNGEKYLAAAIQSALDQTYRPIEVIVVDDASTDRSAEIATSLGPPVRVLRNQRNMGPSWSRNRAVRESSGELIAFLDADDISLPERLRQEVDFLDRNPHVGMVGAQKLDIDRDGRVLGAVGLPTTPGLIRWHLLFHCPISNSSVLMRRELFQQAGGYPEGMLLAEDYDLWVRLAQITRLANLPDVLVHYRQWGSNATITHSAEKERLARSVRQRAAAALLGESVPAETVAVIMEHQTATDREITAAAALLLRMYSTASRLPEVTPADRRVIRGDTCRRLFAMARPRLGSRIGVKLLLDITRIDPFFLARRTASKFD